jgi:hypothetical protein
MPQLRPPPADLKRARYIAQQEAEMRVAGWLRCTVVGRGRSDRAVLLSLGMCLLGLGVGARVAARGMPQPRPPPAGMSQACYIAQQEAEVRRAFSCIAKL